ncbi:MAG TPA: S8 family serine peptidase, partial [Chloroflexota bacterium]|nr:S8 family serine peptidase [Chloroflexota bacterium]
MISAIVAATPLSASAQTAPGAVAGSSAAAATASALPHQDKPVTVRRGNQTSQFYPLKTTRTASGAEVVADRLIVGLKPTVQLQAFADVHQQASAHGAGAARVVATTGAAQIVDISGATSLEQAIHAYQADPRVRYAEADTIQHVYEVPNDQYFGQQWGLNNVQAPQAWNVTHGSASRFVAVLDTGIYDEASTYPSPDGGPGHPDLRGKVAARVNFTTEPNADDFEGHGTHVAGIVSALTNNSIGVSGAGYLTRLLNVKVGESNGSIASSAAMAGIRWAADNGANVISMSFGSVGTCPAAYQDAIDYAWARNVIIVASAGNNSNSSVTRPASCQHVIAVASTDSNDAISSFSTYGTWVQVAAPGGFNALGHQILSTSYDGYYVEKAGTSMAAPLVSGVAALVWASAYGSSNQAVVNRLLETADRVGGTGSLWAYGRINAAAAVTPPVSLPTSGLIQSLPSPQRIADSRSSGGAIGTGQTRCFPVAGLAGIPSDAAAVVLNVTAVGYGTQGWLSVYPNGQAVPGTSTVNFDTSEYAMANGTIMKLGIGGQVCVNVGTINSAPGNSQVILDATGYLSTAALVQMPMLAAPQRVVDTRSTGGAIGTGQSRCFTVAGVAGVPADAAAVVLNVTAVGYGTKGWLSVYPNGQSVPATSTVNFDTSEYAIANGTIMRVG